MLHDHFIRLITKSLTQSSTPAEEAELQQLLQEPEARQRYEAIKKFWMQDATTAAPDTEVALQNVLAQINRDEPEPLPQPQKKFPVFRMVMGFAASVLVAAIVWWAVQRPKDVEGTKNPVAQTTGLPFIEKQNLKGTRSVIALADGSKVWLNADSRLHYPPAFTGATREVELSGEAFFEVTKNPHKPFIIHLSNGTVKVLGTSFNIKAYPGENKIETSVSTGRVAFIPKTAGGKKTADTTFLTKNIKAVYNLQSGLVKTVNTSGAEDKAWTEGKLIFHSTGMDEIALALERYFGKEVVINDEEIHGYHLTGSFENNSVEEILYYLSKTKPFTYKITEQQIIISLVR